MIVNVYPDESWSTVPVIYEDITTIQEFCMASTPPQVIIDDLNALVVAADNTSSATAADQVCDAALSAAQSNKANSSLAVVDAKKSQSDALTKLENDLISLYGEMAVANLSHVRRQMSLGGQNIPWGTILQIVIQVLQAVPGK